MGRLLTEKGKDRLAAAVIRGGGLLVILAVVAIVADIGLEALPLLKGATTAELQPVALQKSPLLVGTDSRQNIVWTLDRDGAFSFPSHPNMPNLFPLDEATSVVAADSEVHGLISILTVDGRATVGKIRFMDQWSGDERQTKARWRAAVDPLPLPVDGNWAGITANADSDGNIVLLAWNADQGATIHHWDGEDEEWSELVLPESPKVTSAAVAEGLEMISLVDSAGNLQVFERRRNGVLRELDVAGLDVPVATVRYLIGGGTLVAAGTDGSLQVLLSVPQVTITNNGSKDLQIDNQTIPPGTSSTLPDDEVGRRLASNTDAKLQSAPPIITAVRTLKPLDGTPTLLAASPRRKSFLVGTDSGRIGLYHATSGRRLVNAQWGEASPVTSIAMAPKADGLVGVTGSELIRRSIDNPHPEVSLRTLFLPVWYEGYARPRLVWQSTGGSDAFEPKLSIVPLIFGTLKATLYAMIISIPLAVLAALYVSQLGPPWFRSVVKPIIELMAAVPSVVVGFLAALWLAPRLEIALLSTLTGMLALPVAIGLALGLWRLLPASAKRRLDGAAELLVPMISATVLLAAVVVLVDPLEQTFFDGDFGRWLFTTAGFRYDQRNALVVGVALGFAVIPVIFTLAENAFSSVPRTLVNASRALGATRWQTARHLVLPASTAGIFAAVILGLGRAVGETMIVLMAAGNTPLLDLSPFNGMRTMSAAIAVEIPEAPVDGTLFRVLFLTGFLLFAFTLVLTTVADQVGRIMRRKYGAR